MLGIGVVSSQQNSYQVYGFITDSTSGEALIGANVFIRETGQGMATDNNGYYVLSGIQSEVVELVVSYVGYQQYYQPLNFMSQNSQNINGSQTRNY